ncbi:toxin [Rickettsia rhipicephali]|uniref:hypothetical protein n=1 Tax=Rickettsia rhipicephali TaxID=33992 RepID=UPI00070E92E3|nr:hypothetical protein [Rickettsia rhipicephali]ALN41454.1 toxin [Rickettsia rhipicephali]
MTKKCNYSFSAEKNYRLISERKVSFEEIISVIESNCLLDIIEHPNPNNFQKEELGNLGGFLSGVVGSMYVVNRFCINLFTR